MRESTFPYFLKIIPLIQRDESSQKNAFFKVQVCELPGPLLRDHRKCVNLGIILSKKCRHLESKQQILRMRTNKIENLIIIIILLILIYSV